MAFYFLICLIATTLGALCGIGGGIIIKPVMDIVTDISVETVSFLSGCTVLAMSAVSLLLVRGGDAKIEVKKSTSLALGAAVGGIAGKVLFDLIRKGAVNDGSAGMTQSALLFLLTLGVLAYMTRKSHIRTIRASNIFLCAIIGLLLGITGSFLGIGGGPINLIVLYYFFSMDAKSGAINSIYIIFFSQAAGLIWSFAHSGIPPFSLQILIAMVAGGVFGGFAGRGINRFLSAVWIERVFYVLLVAIAGASAYNFANFAAIIR